MLCEFKINGEIKKFRVSLVSNYKNEGYKMDYQLTCINEDHLEDWDNKVIPHDKFKEAARQGKIKVTI